MWAVGCIIAEMFVGKPLIPGTSTVNPNPNPNPNPDPNPNPGTSTMNQLECVLEVTG